MYFVSPSCSRLTGSLWLTMYENRSPPVQSCRKIYLDRDECFESVEFDVVDLQKRFVVVNIVNPINGCLRGAGKLNTNRIVQTYMV